MNKQLYEEIWNKLKRWIYGLRAAKVKLESERIIKKLLKSNSQLHAIDSGAFKCASEQLRWNFGAELINNWSNAAGE